MHLLDHLAEVSSGKDAIGDYPGHLLSHFLVCGLAEVHEVVGPCLQNLVLVVLGREIALPHHKAGEVGKRQHIELRYLLCDVVGLRGERLRRGAWNAVNGIYGASVGGRFKPAGVVLQLVKKGLLCLQLRGRRVELVWRHLRVPPLLLDFEFLKVVDKLRVGHNSQAPMRR
ncbi:MAG: hypothetical protein MJY89_06260 [Bacteroidales bacterium]|nr:hypothetical protein [Bacteroidales bacterium]